MSLSAQQAADRAAEAADVERARRLVERLRATPAAQLALVDRLRRLPADRRRAILSRFSARELAAIAYEWRRFWARPDQLAPPGFWTFWCLIGGRGSGKTRSAAEFIRERVRTRKAKRVHFIAATPEDAAEVMVNGPSGIRTISPPAERPEYFPSKGVGGKLVWPNGVEGFVFSAEAPKHLRGPQCSDLWCDDIAAWGPGAEQAWKQAMWGFRLGDPRCVISTTPIAVPLVVSLMRDRRRGLVMTESATDFNESNLAAAFFENVIDEFAGTTFEQQERFGKLSVDTEGSIFKAHWIEPFRVAELPPLVRVVVGVDPPDANTDKGDECGIVVVGIAADGDLYVLADLSGPHTAEQWAKLTVQAFHDYKAELVVVEANRGRGTIERNLAIEAAHLPIEAPNASDSKPARASALSHFYQKGRVHHWRKGPGILSRLHRRPREQAWRPECLEEEMCSWVPGKGRSPNGVDALVWAASRLLPTFGTWSDTAKHAPTEEAPPDPFRYVETAPDEYRYSGSADDYG